MVVTKNVNPTSHGIVLLHVGLTAPTVMTSLCETQDDYALLVWGAASLLKTVE
jgi:hypothetical protein